MVNIPVNLKVTSRPKTKGCLGVAAIFPPSKAFWIIIYLLYFFPSVKYFCPTMVCFLVAAALWKHLQFCNTLKQSFCTYKVLHNATPGY